MTDYPWMHQTMLRVATHGCPHHLDELVAVSLIRHWAAERSTEVDVCFLSRQQIAAGVSDFDVLVDIGGEWNPTAGRFDHHQGGAEVEGRSSAGLVFDVLFSQDDRHDFLKPVIEEVDRLDCGGSLHAVPDVSNRGTRMTSLTAVLKAVGGFAVNPEASDRCLTIVESLVDTWLHHASDFADAPKILRSGQTFGRTVLLDSDEHYGPGLLEYLSGTDVARIGFPAGANRYHLVALRDRHGQLIAPLRSDEFPNAQFVHAKGFLAVFANRKDAVYEFTQLRSEQRIP